MGDGATPAATPVTTPAGETVATRGFAEVQVNVWPAIDTPLELCAEATIEMVDPMNTLVVDAASTAIDATAGTGAAQGEQHHPDDRTTVPHGATLPLAVRGPSGDGAAIGAAASIITGRSPGTAAGQTTTNATRPSSFRSNVSCS